MADDENRDFEKEAVEENPAQTVAPPQLTLQEEPIPNPDIKNKN